MIHASKLLLATRNEGKLVELTELLASVPVELVSPDDLGVQGDVSETGATFRENARLKARGHALLSGVYSLADDSGLEVDALNGRPGVHSARYGGRAASYPEKIASLLSEIERSGDKDRRARFVCSLALADPMGEIVYETDGVCEGIIAALPRGTGGFGYDPIFVPDGFDETFGELAPAIKEKIGHRARAFRQIIPILRRFLAI